MGRTSQEPNQEALEKLRAAIAAAGGATAVARKIGSNRSHIWNVMHGTRELGRDTASKLRSVLDIESGTLLDLLAPEVSAVESEPAA